MENRTSILIILLAVILIFETTYIFRKSDAIETISYKITNKEKQKDDLILSIFMNKIKSDSNTFYDEFFSIHLTYYDYETKILDIRRESESQRKVMYITFGSTPMIGAHNPVGYDKISYRVDDQGNISLEKFNHVKSFEIPEWQRDTMIQPYP